MIAAYAFATRYFNGEYYDFVKEAVTCIITVSLFLKANQNFEDFNTSVKSVEFQCMQVSGATLFCVKLEAVYQLLERLDSSRCRKFQQIEGRRKQDTQWTQFS